MAGNNRSIPDCSVIPELPYADARKAAVWLSRAFGFQERLRIGSHRVQLVYGNGAIVATDRATAGSNVVHAVLVRVADAQAHCEQARQAGARILSQPMDQPYGERQYSAQDLGGHVWTFSQTLADVDPAQWGGELLV